MKEKITDVKGVGPATAAVLAAHGIRTVRDLASATLARLTGIRGFSEFRAGQIKFNAESLLKKSGSLDARESRARSKAQTVAKTTASPSPASSVKKEKKSEKQEKNKKAKKEARRKDKEKNQLKKKTKKQEKTKDKPAKKVKKKK